MVADRGKQGKPAEACDDIKVAVNDDKTTLNGTVNYWSEYDAAKNAAFNTNGVGAVVNQLNVRDYADSAAFQTGRRSFPERATISAG